MTTATTELPFKLGKLPARPDAVSLKLATYADIAAVAPQVPMVLGHYQTIKQWPMYANDQWGDCVEAEAGHSTQLFVAEGRGTVSFTDKNILDAYSAIAGFDINDPSSDQGTDMAQAMAWRRKVGLRDASGARHKIAAYVALQPGNLDQLAVALWWFHAVPIGIRFPRFAMDQFDAGQPWDVSRKNTKIEGGHCISIVGRVASGNFLAVTWGRLIEVTAAFLKKYMDEAIAIVSLEVLYSGVNVDGLGQMQLLADLRRVTSVRVPAPSDIARHRPNVVTPAKGKSPAPAKKAAAAKPAAKKAPAKKSAPRKRAK